MPQAAEVLYVGNLNRQLIQDVREGKYNVQEGVIAKGSDFMVKIKTIAYYEKLYNQFPEQAESEQAEE